MKALRKLLAGTILVALTAFGLTALTSSSTNSAENTQVWGFLNKTCDSDIAVLLESIEDMLKLKGQERHGIILDFESYYRVAELHQERPQCYQVSALLKEPEVIAKSPPVTIIPADPPPGGGGGEGEGGGGGQAPKQKSVVEFDNQNARELKNCIANKLDKLDLKKAEETVDKKHLGCFVNLGMNLEFKKTDFTWGANQTDQKKIPRKIWGQTIYTNTIADSPIPDNSVFLYPVVIKKKVNTRTWRRKGVTFDNLSEFVALEEIVHTIQGHNAKQANSNWKNPEPYELRDWQIQANIVANIWYKQLKGDKNSPISMYTPSMIDKHRDINCDLEEEGDFLKNKKQYIKYVEQLKNKNLTETERTDIEGKKEALVTYFNDELFELQNHLSGSFDKAEKLKCSKAEKQP